MDRRIRKLEKITQSFMKYIMVFKSKIIGVSCSRYDRDFSRQTSKTKKTYFEDLDADGKNHSS